MEASVLIPTYGRASKLKACLASLAKQETRSSFEVVVGVDGGAEDPDQEARVAAEAGWREGSAGQGRSMRVMNLPREGYTLVRNRLVSMAAGRLMISLNDDVVCEAGFVEAHLAAHKEKRAPSDAIVVGDSPYVVRENETLLDRLVRCTNMVFFYDVMNTPEGRSARDRDWGFRHCFGLNFSVSMDAVREVGGFFARPHLYGYDDIELGFRLAKRYGMPVLYRPEAKLWHDHHYEPAQILERERKLGESAWVFAGACREFGMAVFGRDIRSADEIEYSRQFVARERGAAERARLTFERIGALPAAAVDGPHEALLLQALAQQHLVAKRWEWRSGLLSAAERDP